MDVVDKSWNTLTKIKSNNSKDAIDRCEYDSREIPLNGFNRFDPKYISIGPKAFSESFQKSGNQTKCATLRHGGRYGGSLTERRVYPVLKKASPPSVKTIPKKSDSRATVENEMYASSNTLIGVSRDLVFDYNYEKNTGGNFLYRRPEQKQANLNENNKIEISNLVTQPTTVYSIDATSFQTVLKAAPHIQSQRSSSNIKPYSHSSQILSLPKILAEQNPTATAQNNSIMSQPLPSIPQISHDQRNAQPLSPSNLDNLPLKSASVEKSEANESSTIFHHNKRHLAGQPSQHFQLIMSSQPVQSSNQPPSLPPKKKNKDQHSSKTVSRGNQKHQSRTKDLTSQKVQRSSFKEGNIPMSDQQKATYCTLDYDYGQFSRNNRRCPPDREPIRIASKTLSNPIKSSSNSRHQKQSHTKDHLHYQYTSKKTHLHESGQTSTNSHSRMTVMGSKMYGSTNQNYRNMNNNLGTSVDAGKFLICE